MNKQVKKVAAAFCATLISVSGWSQYVDVEIQDAFPVNNPPTKEGWDLVKQYEFNTTSWANDWDQKDDPMKDEVFADGNFQINQVNNDYIQLTIERLEPPQAYTYQDPNNNYVTTTADFPFRTQYIRSKDRFNEGFFEARIKMPLGRGTWPAFWLVDNELDYFSTGSQYSSSELRDLYNEIDIFENFPQDDYATRITSNIHVDTEDHILNGNYGEHQYLGGLGVADYLYYSGPEDLNQAWHTYGCEWGDDYVRWYLNNKLIKEVTVNDSPAIADLITYLRNNMKIILDVSLRPEEYTPSFTSGTMEIDYVRVFKKKPTITVDSPNCLTNGIQFTADAEGENTYSWTVVGGTQITGFNGSNVATFMRLKGFSSMTVCVTATNNVGNSSTSCYTYPGLDAEFEITSSLCVSNDIQVTAVANTTTPGSWWAIYNADANGNITDWNKLNPDIFGDQATFSNIGLQYGNDYVIAHGVWDNCVPWVVEYEHLKLELSDFYTNEPVCNNNVMSVSGASLHNTQTGSRWDLYHGDEFGNILDFTPIETQWGNSFQFNNLERDKWYAVNHGIWGDCAGNWTVTRKPVYVPSFKLNPDFDHIAVWQPDPVYDEVFQINCFAQEYSVGSNYKIFLSNENADWLSQVYSSASGSCFFTTVPSSLDQYYLVIHEAWSNCSDYRYSAKLIHVLDGSSQNIKSLEDYDELESKMNVQVYPNPTSGQANVNLGETVSGEIIVRSVDGREVIRDTFTETDSFTFELEQFESGQYIIHLLFRDGTIKTKKIVKE